MDNVPLSPLLVVGSLDFLDRESASHNIKRKRYWVIGGFLSKTLLLIVLHARLSIGHIKLINFGVSKIIKLPLLSLVLLLSLLY